MLVCELFQLSLHALELAFHILEVALARADEIAPVHTAVVGCANQVGVGSRITALDALLHTSNWYAEHTIIICSATPRGIGIISTSNATGNITSVVTSTASDTTKVRSIARRNLPRASSS